MAAPILLVVAVIALLGAPQAAEGALSTHAFRTRGSGPSLMVAEGQDAE